MDNVITLVPDNARRKAVLAALPDEEYERRMKAKAEDCRRYRERLRAKRTDQ
jgi:hypothetical protein